MPRHERKWHPNFTRYMKFVANHPNYEGMPHLYKKDRSIRWVVTGNSSIGRERREWWNKKREELNISKDRGWLAKTASAIHPTGRKVCQICGREMSVHYVYPRKLYLDKLNRIRGMKSEFTIFDEIDKIVKKIVQQLGEEGYYYLQRIFKVPSENPRTTGNYTKYIMEKCRTKLSPGVMSNAPDRFDGFHSYNRCCRKEQDTGRHDENLERYIEDRRAYEHWADGDWKAASWLMKGEKDICPRCGKEAILTADHIGPISLGFKHRPKFQPLCRTCNSAKNNRMMLSDIKLLISDEKSGDEVVSWHSKAIWDLLKNSPKNDRDARKVSRLMRTHHHHVMEIFYIISLKGYKDFLLNFLHPEYAYYSIEIENLNKKTFEYDRIVKKKGTKKQYENNAARYVRIAFESLDEYHSKTIDNRRIKEIMNNTEVHERIELLSVVLEDKGEYDNIKARNLLNKALSISSKKQKENLIKIALDEFSEKPTKNSRAKHVLNDLLGSIATEIAKDY